MMKKRRMIGNINQGSTFFKTLIISSFVEMHLVSHKKI